VDEADETAVEGEGVDRAAALELTIVLATVA